MMLRKIKIKEKFQGLVITKNLFPIGMVTLDTNTARPEHYQRYIELGFQDIFDVTDEETGKSDCGCEGQCACKTKSKKKYKNVKHDQKNEGDTGSEQ